MANVSVTLNSAELSLIRASLTDLTVAVSADDATTHTLAQLIEKLERAENAATQAAMGGFRSDAQGSR